MKNNTIIGFVLGVIIAFITISSVWGIGKLGKYEKETAEEWSNKYSQEKVKHDNLLDCLGRYVGLAEEDYSANDLWLNCFPDAFSQQKK